MFQKLYDTVYFAAELRAQKELAGGESSLSDAHKGSLGDLKTTGQRVQRFFGLPAGDSLAEVAKNFSFWRSDFSTRLKVLWGISLLVVVPVQISLVVLKCLRNILKLFTEFLPGLLAKLSFRAFSESINVVFSKDEGSSAGERFLAGFFVLLTSPLFLAFELCYLIGCATTSPVESVRASYEWGSTKLHPALGVLLAGLSVALTACVYAVLFPLAIKFILMQTAAVVSSAPHWVISMLDFIAEQGVGFSSFLSSILPSSWLTAFNAPLLASLMAGLSLVGITLFGGVASVGAVVDRATDPGDDDHSRPRLEAIVERGQKPVSQIVYNGIFHDQDTDRAEAIAEMRSDENGKRSLISPTIISHL